MDKQMIEYYQDNGLMPDWWYYQVNGKSAEENYIDIVNKRDRKYRDEVSLKREQEELEKQAEEELEKTLEKALDDILKDLKF